MEILYKDDSLFIVPQTVFEQFILEEQFGMEGRVVLENFVDPETKELSYLRLSKTPNGIKLDEDSKIVAEPLSESEIDSLYRESLDEKEINCEVEI